MSQLLEYTQNHPFLVAATAILAVLAIVFELRHRRSGGASIGAAQAVALLNAGALAVDIRNPEAFNAGHITAARNVSPSELERAQDSLKKYREKPLIVYCDNGMASASAVRMLKSQGFTKVVSLRGGLNGWRQESLPLVKTVGRKEGK
jgi:rhodanese-related sulfurtransferase